MEQDGWRFNTGEAFKKVINASGTTDSEKVLVPIDPEEQMNAESPLDENGEPIPQDPGMQQPPVDPMTQQKMQQSDEKHQMDMQAKQMQLDGKQQQMQPQQDQSNEELQVTMQEYGVPEEIARAVMEARRRGYEEEEIVKFLKDGSL
jgi:hypothetical protein